MKSTAVAQAIHKLGKNHLARDGHYQRELACQNHSLQRERVVGIQEREPIAGIREDRLPSSSRLVP